MTNYRGEVMKTEQLLIKAIAFVMRVELGIGIYQSESLAVRLIDIMDGE